MPVFTPVEPPKNPDQCEPWLYEAIKRLNRQASGSSQGFASIVRGESPDSSGTPLVNLTDYFYKPGVQGGQLAYGGKLASENLTFSSTAAAAKGLIYLGSGRISAYDEANQRLGVGVTTPSARVHIVGESTGGTVTLLPSSDVNNGAHGSGDLVGLTTTGSVAGWSCYSGAGTSQPPPAYVAIATNDDDTLYIANETSASGGSHPQSCGLGATISGSHVYTITYRIRWLSLPVPGSLNISFRLVDSSGNYFSSPIIPVNDGSVTTSWITFTTTINTASGGTPGGTPNSIEILGPNTNRYFLCTYIAVSYSAGADLLQVASSNATVGLRVDGNRYTGIGTGVVNLTRNLTVQSAGEVAIGVLTSSPILNMMEWLDGATERAAVTKDGYFSSRAFLAKGSTSGTLTLQGAPVTTSYTLTLPDVQGAVDSFPRNDGSGILAFVTPVAYEDDLIIYEDELVWY